MNTRTWWTIIGLLLVVIVVLMWFLFETPTPAPQPVATSTAATTTSAGTSTTAQPLSKEVLVTSPQANATVGKTFIVSGVAPGPWFFEAVFPIQVRDAGNNVIGRSQGQAQGEWMTEGVVTFTSNMTVSDYTGPATLVLMRDNPSGLPQNDDSVSIPISIQ